MKGFRLETRLLLPRLAKTSTTSRLTCQKSTPEQVRTRQIVDFMFVSNASRLLKHLPCRFLPSSSQIHDPSIRLALPSPSSSQPNYISTSSTKDYSFGVMGQTPSGDELGSRYNVELASSEACRWTSELHCYGQGEDYNWGFRIYRTTYTTESDRGWRTLT